MPICNVCGRDFRADECPVCGTVPGTGPTTRPQFLPPVGATAQVGPRPMLGDIQIEGTVIQTSGPTQMPRPRDPWRWSCGFLAFLIFFPVAVTIGLFFFTLSLALRIVGFGSGGLGSMGSLFFYHLISGGQRRPEPIPVYHHVLETEAGRSLVRQEGDFRDGSIIVGNRVRLTCRSRRGALHIESGYNETLQAPLTRPRSPWQVMFWILMILIGSGLAYVWLVAPDLSTLGG